MPMEPLGERFADLALQGTRKPTAQGLAGTPGISRSKVKDKANCRPFWRGIAGPYRQILNKRPRCAESLARSLSPTPIGKWAFISQRNRLRR